MAHEPWSKNSTTFFYGEQAMPKDLIDANNVVAIDFAKKKSVQTKAISVEERLLNEKKRALFDKWLSFGCVSVLFDARMEGVKVPTEFADRGDLRLNFSYDFMVADFSFNEQQVWATLSFDSGEYFCAVPWKSVYGLQSEKLHQGAVWFDSFPDDYDQVKVLGFSESMCEEFGSPLSGLVEEAEPQEDGNVVQLNFSPDNDSA